MTTPPGTPPSTPLIVMHDIVKRFNIGTPNEQEILHNVGLTVTQGEFVSIVGASGSGKSTLMNIIGLLDVPTSGTYELAGTQVTSLSPDETAHLRSTQIGFVFQNFNLIGRMSAVNNVEIPLMYAGVGRKARRERARELLELVGMANRMDFEPNQLSGGQKQRVAIARALACGPAIVLADEPTGALDTHTGRQVMDIFHDLHAHGTTLVLITHNPELAAETSRVLTMTDGLLTGPDGGQDIDQEGGGR